MVMDELQDGLSSGITGAFGGITTFISEKPLATAAIVGGTAAIGGGIIAASLIKRKSKRKAKRKTTKGRRRDRRYISKQKHERKRERKRPAKIYKRKGLWLSRSKKAKRKAPSTRRRKVYYARKTGQPYIKLKSGKTRFIKGKRRLK